MVQSVERPTSAQLMISQSVSSSPMSGSVLTAQSLEPASDSVSPSLSAPPLLMLCLSLSQKLIKKKKKKKKTYCPKVKDGKLRRTTKLVMKRASSNLQVSEGFYSDSRIMLGQSGP